MKVKTKKLKKKVKTKKLKKKVKTKKIKYGEKKKIPNEGRYIGKLNENKERHGYGKMFYDNGEIYEGQWQNNKRNGNGTLFNANGKVIYHEEWYERETPDDIQSELLSRPDELSEMNNEVAPKKTITIMINAHGKDLLQQPSDGNNPNYRQLYPNEKIKADVRILSQAGNTCSYSATFHKKGNAATSIGNNFSNLFKNNPQLTTFEILNLYRFGRKRKKYSHAVKSKYEEYDTKTIETSRDFNFKNTLKNSQLLENFSLFTPIVDHIYSFVDHNNSLQNNPGIFVLNIRNFPECPLNSEITDLQLTETNQELFYYIFIDFLNDIIKKYSGNATNQKLLTNNSELYAYRIQNQNIITKWKEMLNINKITTIDQLFNYINTDINNLNFLYFEDKIKGGNMFDNIRKLGKRFRKLGKRLFGRNADASSTLIPPQNAKPIDNAKDYITELFRKLLDHNNFSNNPRKLDNFLINKVEFEKKFDEQIFNKLNIAKGKYLYSDIDIIFKKCITKLFENIGIKPETSLERSTLEHLIKNIHDFHTLYSKIKKFVNEVDIKNKGTESKLYMNILEPLIEFVKQYESQDKTKNRLQFEENCISVMNEIITKIDLTTLIDILHINYGFEVINIIDLSCREYAFDNWEKDGEYYEPPNAEKDKFTKKVKKIENQYKYSIDHHYGGKTKKRRKYKTIKRK